jgi:hypothetical protein
MAYGRAPGRRFQTTGRCMASSATSSPAPYAPLATATAGPGEVVGASPSMLFNKVP